MITSTYALAAHLVGALWQAAQQTATAATPASVQEHVLVERVVISGRVIDRFGNPIQGLTAADLRLRIDGHEWPIEALDWIGSEDEAPPSSTMSPAPTARRAETAGPGTRTTASRTVVMIFQWEIAGQKDSGFLRMMRQAEKMIEDSSASDRIAVLGFGSSLHVLQDFTADRGALRQAIESIRSLSFHGRTSVDPPTIASAIAACPSTDSIQKAVQCVGVSLQPIPGPKTLLFFGWTIGRPRRAAWHLEYPAMVDALGKARTSVFVLDVSDGFHSLAPALIQIAADTGGLYNGGCIYEMAYCADLARVKTQRAFSGGRYDVVFRDLTSARGWHEVDIEVRQGGGIPIFQRWYRN